MSAAVLPSKSCLIAVLLVVQTTSEPRLVFQYPPKPEEDNTRFHELLAKINRSDESSSSSEDDEASSSDEKGSTKNDKVDVRENHSPPELDETGSASPSKRTEGHDNDVDTEEVRIFGYPPNVLAKVLCPSASSHRKKTEIGLDGKVFVGQPMFVGADGSWRKRKTRASFGKSVATDSGLGPLSTDSVPLHQMETNEIEISEIEEGDMEDDEHMARAKSDDDQAWNDGPAESLNISTKTEKAVNMFHVSFVLRPAPLEFHQRVKDIYHNIVKPFANDLRYEQARSNYVGRQTSVINSINKKPKTMRGHDSDLTARYREAIKQSSLARAIATVFNSISTSQIAQVHLEVRSRPLQIPQANFLTSLPSPLAPQRPGSMLTTALSTPHEDDATSAFSHFGLLLLDDLKIILEDIKAVGQEYQKYLNAYLRVSKPTKSFQQISHASDIPLHAILHMATYLISWRRAQTIPPLKQRDIYIASPSADMQNVSNASFSFAKAFPALPPLPKILSSLSSTPRPYSTLIPSKDYKESYMHALAWLMRGGWVAHLRCFSWVRVPSHIIRSCSERPTSGMKDSTSQIEEQNANHDSTSSSSPASNQSTASITVHLASKIKGSPIIISNPRLANSEQSRYLSAISVYVREEQGEEASSAWDICVNYFDGKHALETIAVAQGWKGKNTASLLAGWEELGILLKTRHW